MGIFYGGSHNYEAEERFDPVGAVIGAACLITAAAVVIGVGALSYHVLNEDSSQRLEKSKLEMKAEDCRK